MAGLNKVMLIGNLGRDPEIRYSQQGMAVVNFSIATSEQWTDKNTGEKQEKTEWHRVVAFGKPAEILEKYLSKGNQVYIEGRLQTRNYEKTARLTISRRSWSVISNFSEGDPTIRVTGIRLQTDIKGPARWWIPSAGQSGAQPAEFSWTYPSGRRSGPDAG